MHNSVRSQVCKLQRDGRSASAVLGLCKYPSKPEIRARYKILARLLHPDKNPEAADAFLCMCDAASALLHAGGAPEAQPRPHGWAGFMDEPQQSSANPRCAAAAAPPAAAARRTAAAPQWAQPAAPRCELRKPHAAAQAETLSSEDAHPLQGMELPDEVPPRPSAPLKRKAAAPIAALARPAPGGGWGVSPRPAPVRPLERSAAESLAEVPETGAGSDDVQLPQTASAAVQQRLVGKVRPRSNTWEYGGTGRPLATRAVPIAVVAKSAAERENAADLCW